jgi:hypothetical protein
MGCGGLLAVFTVHAHAYFLQNFLDHQQLRGNVFVTFARFFPDVAQVFAAGGAVFFFFGQIVFDPFALQMQRQGASSPRAACFCVPACASTGGRMIVLFCFCCGFRSVEFLSE